MDHGLGGADGAPERYPGGSDGRRAGADQPPSPRGRRDPPSCFQDRGRRRRRLGQLVCGLARQPLRAVSAARRQARAQRTDVPARQPRQGVHRRPARPALGALLRAEDPRPLRLATKLITRGTLAHPLRRLCCLIVDIAHAAVADEPGRGTMPSSARPVPGLLDRLVIEFVGTDDRSGLGANAVLGVSLAAARASAASAGLPLYRHLSAAAPLLPVPLVNLDLYTQVKTVWGDLS